MCPFCNRHATITHENRHSNVTFLTIDNAEGAKALISSFVVCPNPECRKFTANVALCEAGRDARQNMQPASHIRTWSLIPSSRAQPFPSYIPKAILDDYNEACLIRDLSPKASATLARRCLQGIIRDFWQVKPGRLVDEIAVIKDKIDPLTWQAIEAVRKVGNIGAHMESDIDLIVEVEPNEAGLLIELIEVLLKDWHIARENKKAHLSALVQLAADKENEKKGKSTAAS